MGRSNKHRRGGGGAKDPNPLPSQQDIDAAGPGGGGGGGLVAPAPNQLSSSQSFSQESSTSAASESVLTKIARAEEIEAGLEDLRAEQGGGGGGGKAPSGRGGGATTSAVPPPPRSSFDERSQSLRLRLCSVLSDVLLVDPIVAQRHDAAGRLWKGCFYGRISELRSRISREKGRAKRRHNGQEGGGGGGDPAAGGRMVADLEGQLSTFLGEAVQLYKYIIERYVVELTPPSSQSQSQSSSRSRGGGGGGGEGRNDDDRARAVVSSLHKMHIHLGDLHRYSSSPADAEACYLVASRLAPGSGNAYNQLAVVAQARTGASAASAATAAPPSSSSSSPEQQGGAVATVLALYYYARSLMSAEEPFDTSRPNLLRLYEANRRWLGEHSRRPDYDGDDDDRRRRDRRPPPAVDGAGGAATMSKRELREQKEWAQRERAVANRRALARFADLQWDFARGFSGGGDGADADAADGGGGIDPAGLVGRASSLLEALTDPLGNASFGESLLCKLVSILAYSTLGAGNGGRPRRRDGTAVVPDQALAFSFCLGFCALLAEDVDAVIAKRGIAATAGGGPPPSSSSSSSSSSGGRLGAIRSLPSLLLGLRFATSIYDGECEWFHAASYLPGGGAGAREESSEDGSIREFCEGSHARFWTSVAKLANRIDGPPKNNVWGGDGGGLRGVTDIAAVGDFDDFRGFVPFASFLDQGRGVAELSPARNCKKAVTYATADEAIRALAKANNIPGGGKGGGGGDASTRAKIDLFLSIVDGRTGADGRCFLRRNAETNGREFVRGDDIGNAEKIPDPHPHHPRRMFPRTRSPPPSSPNFTDMNVEDDLTVARAENATSTSVAVPLINPYSDIGVALLTPAALLAGSAHNPQVNVAANNELKKQLPMSAPIDSILARGINAEASPILSDAPTKGIDSLINISNMTSQPTPLKMPFPPPPGLSPPLGLSAPPGFSVHHQQVRPQMPFTSSTGISLADFLAPRQSELTAGGMIPQAVPNYPSSNIYETMNPFVQQAPLPLSFNSNYFVASSPSKFDQHRGVPFQQPAPNGGLDPTLDFLLGGSRMQHSPDDLVSSDPFNLLLPSAATEVEDQSESILSFLFNSNDTSRPRQPLYAASQQHPLQSQNHGAPQTKNPFAT